MSQPDEPGPDAPPPDDAPAPESLYDILSPWTILFLALGCVILYQVLGVVLWTAGHVLWGLALAPLAGTVAPLVTVVRHLGLPVRRELQLTTLSRSEVLLVVATLGAALFVAHAASALNARWFPPTPESLALYAELVPHDAASFVLGFLGIVVAAPLAEELVFRGLVLNVFAQHLGLPLALTLSALLFGASHMAPSMILPITFLGIVLGVVVWSTGSLTAAWLGHGLFNLAAYVELALTHDPNSSRLEAWASRPLVFGPAILVVLLCLVELARRRDTGGDA
jgi:membrane protease YdiL (CAAX protease family)